MVRKQIYLTEKESADLKELASVSGKKQSELIRQAIDEFLHAQKPENRMQFLQQARGTWQHKQLPADFDAVRLEWDRE